MDITKGKVFIVTGGASGLGEGAARMSAASVVAMRAGIGWTCDMNVLSF